MALRNKPNKSGIHEETSFLSSTRVIRIFAGGSTLKVYIFVCLFIIINFLFPTGKGDEVFDIPQEGEITKKAIIAPFTFDILKTRDEMEKEQKIAIQKILPIVEYNYDVTEKIFAKIKNFFRMITKLKNQDVSDSAKTAIWAELKKDLSQNTIEAFVSSDMNFDNVLYVIDDILDQGICAVYFVKDEKEVDEFKARFNLDYVDYQLVNDGFVTFVRDDKEKTIAIRDLLTKEEVMEKEKARLRKLYSKSMLGPLYEILYAYTAPNIFYLADETQKRRDAAARNVLPTRGKVIKDLEIVGKNKLVTQEIYRNIYSLKVAQDRQKDVKVRRDWYPILGRMLLVLFILTLFFYRLEHYEKRYFSSVRNVIAISVILVMEIAFIAFAYRLVNTVLIPMEWGGDVEWGYLLPFIMGPMLVTVLYDHETGIVFNLVSALLLALMIGFEFRITLVHFFTGIIASRAVNNIRYRSHFLLALLFSCVSYAILITVMGLIQYGELNIELLLRNLMAASVSALFSLVMTIFLIWVFERIFGITTNLTLIELSDMNSPVLKMLSMEAPGTYHHSVLVGNLAESAAEKVNANPLKTRVLAYYHDIGKVFKSEYFIENQTGVIDSLHDKISPRMSAIIVSSHVKQGIELGRKYKLPPAVLDTIREHHGTTLISFFYDRAKEQEPDKNILRDDFCYPGPKPSSRETALIMLADSVEAASRTLTEPTASRLKGLVNSIIDAKIADGQLDNCDLTFIELSEIKESFIPVLTAMFHARIEYPESDAKKAARQDQRKTIKMSLTE